jgi:hypothetical protein
MQHVNENYGSDTDPNIDRIEDVGDNYYQQPLEKKTKKKSKKKKVNKEREESGDNGAGPSMKEAGSGISAGQTNEWGFSMEGGDHKVNYFAMHTKNFNKIKNFSLPFCHIQVIYIIAIYLNQIDDFHYRSKPLL